jgi:hypothetical protein
MTPPEKRKPEAEVDESIEESFPASDPPAHGGADPAPEPDDDTPLLDPDLPD